MDIRLELIKIFEDTVRWIKEDKALSEAKKFSIQNTRLYKAEEYPELPEFSPADTKIQVSGEKSFQAAMRLRKEYPDARIAVHNFASATNPGGGVKTGSRAQEESLCRCSTLYSCLNRSDLWESYYLFHRNRHDVRYTDACIWSPDVLIIKNDDDLPERLPESEFCKVDVLTCAAPNLRPKPYNSMNPGKGDAVQLTDRELADLHRSRARHLLTVAAANHDEVLVLGAFGCGAFRNNPRVVAQVYKEILNEKQFKNRFLHVEFAVFHTLRETENFKAFEKVFSYQ
ncbi:MAG: TIGR02452 family protein [Ruminococcus sp.]|nr:TIGR02452 family protein [Ruminococcus sp.]